MPTVEITQVKCACTDCVCVVQTGTAVRKGEKLYCSDACADGHAGKTGCDHQGCSCRG